MAHQVTNLRAGRSLNRLLLLEHDLTTFDRRNDVQQGVAVAHRVTVDDHDVGQLAGLERTDLGAVHGCGRGILRDDLEAQGIVIRSDSDRGLAEEAPVAYKDINEVIKIVKKTGLAQKVARLRPIAVIKGD